MNLVVHVYLQKSLRQRRIARGEEQAGERERVKSSEVGVKDGDATRAAVTDGGADKAEDLNTGHCSSSWFAAAHNGASWE